MARNIVDIILSNYFIEVNIMKKEYKFKNKEWLIEQIEKYGTVRAICENTNNAETSIRRYINKFNLKHLLTPVDLSKACRKHKLNEDYFEKIDTEDKAYFLGFMMADGNVSNTNNKYCIRISLHIKDAYILEEFRSKLETDSVVKYIPDKNKAELRIWSKKMFYDLEKHGIKPRKTGYETIPNSISNHLLHHFIRGFFDGDGTIYKRKNRKRHKCTIGYVSQSKEMMLSMQSILKNLGITINIHYKENKNCYESKTESVDYCTKFLEYIYKDATISLIRKYKRANEYLNIECASMKKFIEKNGSN